jgi:hypothetical protein
MRVQGKRLYADIVCSNVDMQQIQVEMYYWRYHRLSGIHATSYYSKRCSRSGSWPGRRYAGIAGLDMTIK